MQRRKCEICGEWIEPEDEAWRVGDEAIHQGCANVKENLNINNKQDGEL